MSIRNSERYDFQSREGIDEGITMHAKTESEGKKGLIELTETQVKNIKTMGLAAGGKLSTSHYMFAFLWVLLTINKSPRHIQRQKSRHNMEPRYSTHPLRAHA